MSSTTSNGAHVEVTVRMGDPLTVTDEPCHRGRYFGSGVLREMLRAVGVICADCNRFAGTAKRPGKAGHLSPPTFPPPASPPMPHDVSRREQ